MAGEAKSLCHPSKGLFSMPAASAIFISYRRSDSRVFTDRIYEYLAEHFGSEAVFRDVEAIQIGQKFPVRIQQAVDACQVMIVVIGPDWATVTGKDGKQRLANPNDWVRKEVEGALARGIPIIPLLIEDTRLPAADALPESLKPLRQYNSAPAHSAPYFQFDMKQLTESLEKIIEKPNRSQSNTSASGLVRRRGRLRLNGAQRQQLCETLKSAFPGQSQLELMLESRLELQLNEVAGSGPYPTVLFNLVKAINAQGRVEELLEGALQASNTSPELQELIELWLKE